MEESEEGNLDESNKTDKLTDNYTEADQKSITLTKKTDIDEEPTYDSISEHIASSQSIENDRSLQEIEISNQPSALAETSVDAKVQQDSDENDLMSNLTDTGNDFLDDMGLDQVVNIDNSEPKNSKSILEELLVHSHLESDAEHSKEESFNMFADVDFSDKSIMNLSDKGTDFKDKNIELEVAQDKTTNNVTVDVEKRMKQLEEIVAVKESTINALTQELDSFREMSNPTYTSSVISATEYKQLQEEYHSKLLECNSAIIYKNDLIQQLSESLDQSVFERKELLAQVENFKDEIAQLQIKLQETSIMVKEHQCTPVKSPLESIAQRNNKLEAEVEEQTKLCDINEVIKLKNENLNLTEKLKNDRECYEKEIIRLKDLLESVKCGSTELMELRSELEKKHAKEVEELRTYFEKKCAELEKNYSEEIFSQQSRKMSDSSSDVELSNEFLLSNHPGPGGDHNKIMKSKEDVDKLKDNLTNFLDKISKHSLESLTPKALNKIELEVKNELNILFRLGEKLEIKAIENKYLEEISNLKFQLEESRKDHGNISISSVIQEVGSSGDFEINEVIESYERRLQEQVNLAKIDIINELVEQIQRLVSNSTEEEEWPSELLQLRDKFVEKYETEIENLKIEHENEIVKLKEEHLKILNGALERARRRSLRDEEGKSETDLIRERDNLKKQVISLRNLLSELLSYFTQAEDALNNTLVDELLRQGDKNLEDEVNLDTSSATTNSSKILDSLTHITRVHLTPNFSELINMIEHQSQNSDTSIDISVDLKNELGMCLEKLRQDANTILTLTNNLPKVQNENASPGGGVEDKLNSLSKNLLQETQQKERLKQELCDSNEIISSLEKHKDILESRVDELLEKINVLESELKQTKYKIAELIENGRKEVVSEGYGEGGQPPLPDLDDAMRTLANLQEKARTMLTQTTSSTDPNVLQLIEELCRVGEKIKQEATKEKNEMLQQIDAADKKYRTTQKFLEEQAIEREQERDEAQKKINELSGQLKERDRDRANCLMMSSEQNHKRCGCRSLDVGAYQKVEQLERQINELTQQFHDERKRYKELEDERAETLEKIRILREIIQDLEQQNEEKDRKINEHLRSIEKLECIVQEQQRSLEELNTLNANGDISDIQGLRRHVEELEQEIQKLQIGAELAGTEGAAQQIRIQLFELEVSLDKKTRELELLHSTGTNSCSSPSEDMSVRPQTPNSSVLDECDVPLQQLARLREKLLKHTRAEDAAMKRIRDLEMQLCSMKGDVEEAQNEKDYMKRQIQEQLVLISDLQIRLDHQRIKAEHIEKQTNTSLESKIYDLQNEIVALQETIKLKDKTINHQEQVIREAQERVQDLENDIATTKDDDIIIAMQKELESIRQENAQMKDRLSTENHILPNLVENIISDKNADIEKLRGKLTETEKQLNKYTSLNLDKNDLKTLKNLKDTGGSIEQLISILDLSQPADQIRRMEVSRQDSLSGLNHVSLKRSANDTELLCSSSEPEISYIEKVGPSNLHYTISTALGKPNSTELGHKTCERKVHFEDTIHIDELAKKINYLERQIDEKNSLIGEYETKIRVFNDLEDKIGNLQQRLDETELALSTATKTFEREQEEAKERETTLGVELAARKLKLSEIEKEVQTLRDDSNRKDELYLNLAREKKNVEQELSQLKEESAELLRQDLEEKCNIIKQLQNERTALLEDMKKIENNVRVSRGQMDSLISKTNQLKEAKQHLEDKMNQVDEENSKLQKEIENKNLTIENALMEAKNWKQLLDRKEKESVNLTEELNNKEKTIKELNEAIAKKDALVLDKDCDIEIMSEDMKYYQNQMTELENKIKLLENSGSKKQLDEEKIKSAELAKEINHLQDLVREKERVIAQMTEDHSQVHSNLKIIDNKIKETGNIFDLSGRLKKEQKKTAELLEEVHGLKARLLNYEIAESAPVEEITGQLKKELECAAQIDYNIINAVSDQSLSSISEGHDIEAYKKSLSRQKAHNKQILREKDELERQKAALEQTSNVLQQKLNELQVVLEKERVFTKQTQIEDAKLLEQLRIKLDSVLDIKEELEKVLEEEKHCRRSLEIQLEELKKTGSTSSESTKYKQPPTMELLELNRIQKELEHVREEKTQLTAQVKTLQQENNQLENNVKYTKEMLVLQEERNRTQDEKFRILSEREKSLTDDLLRKKIELEVKGREIEEKKVKMDELEQEKNLLKKQKADLMQALRSQTSMIPTLETNIPDTLQSVIKELTEINNENKRRIERIESEKRALEFQLRTELSNNVKNNMPFPDLVARCDYLFSKALKLESIRKALIWQKRYLVDFLKSHQQHCLIEVLPNQPHENHCLRNRHTPLEHFRSAVYAVIAIERMKYLVQRWHSGVRKSERINARHYERSKQKYLSESLASAANFQVGQPVSNQNFSHRANRPNNHFNQDVITSDESRTTSPPRLISPSRDTPWSGSTPPSKENLSTAIFRIGSNVINRDDITPLKAPQLLAQFQERFDQIQEKLGVPFSEDNLVN
ncbi:uncharacterized protein LOC143202700 isoform X3 [Rhynchophorus ferrugineus]|uniref:uncharacterized protein LOC143202700 isoform X3 n=1 Tax=Rhynchophorus ferrugineus TaxID=354439 RepID=UPI003FCE7508